MKPDVARLLHAQGGICFLCLQTCIDPTIEHVIPMRRTVRDHNRTLAKKRLNQVAACRHCNAMKASRAPTYAEMRRLLWLNRARSGEDTEKTWLTIT